MRRLAEATLPMLPAEVARPTYDRGAVRAGVVHLGIGAFHRAHQAVAFDDCLTQGDLRWGVIGVSMRSSAIRDALGPQDGLYSVVERGADRETIRVIGAIRAVLVAPEEPARVVAALASPDVRLVTLTITEQGYRTDPSSGRLLVDDADVMRDLADLIAPRTAVGFLVAGLARRRAAGLMPFTAISCDNLPDNGPRLRSAVLTMARRHDPALADWIERDAAFPRTMVDRIVPATRGPDRDVLEQRIGLRDEGMVVTEPFLQWVIEDRFAGPRPRFATPGIVIAPDVEAWERAKLRMLNGAHSAMAYLGGLAGIPSVAAFLAWPSGRRFVEALWDELQPTLSPPAGLDLDRYRERLMTRFANTALDHRLDQIAVDGSQKLPQRLVAPLAERLAAGSPAPMLSLAVAGWMRWQAGVGDAGVPHVVSDPLADRIAAALADTRGAEATVDALMSIDVVFPPNMASSDMASALTGALKRLVRDGAGPTVEHFA